MTQSTFWTPARRARLDGLAAEGISTARIAEAMGDGCTKNMVVGRLARSGLTTGVPSKRPSEPTPTLDRRLRYDRVTQRGCVWVEGDPRGEWRWCGSRLAEAGSPYCARHAELSRGRPAGAGDVAPMPGRAIGLSRAAVMDD